MISALLILALAQAPPLPRLEGPSFVLPRIAIAAYGVGQFTDGMVTAYGLGRGDFHEANPVLRWAEHRPVAMSLTKGAVAAASVYLLIKAHRHHPKATFVMATVLAVAQAFVTTRNVRLLR